MKKICGLCLILSFSWMIFSFHSADAKEMKISVPGETAADQRGVKSILDQIKWLEDASGYEDCFITVTSTRRVGMELSTIVEHWTLQVCDQPRIYKIRISSDGRGSTKYSVTFPMPAELIK